MGNYVASERERNGVRGSLYIPVISGYTSCSGFYDIPLVL